MTLPLIHFVQQIPVIGTSLRIDLFDADLGWLIEPLDGGAVRLSRPANPAQNVPAIAPFVVVGVAYSAPDARPLEEETQRHIDEAAIEAARAGRAASYVRDRMGAEGNTGLAQQSTLAVEDGPSLAGTRRTRKR